MSLPSKEFQYLEFRPLQWNWRSDLNLRLMAPIGLSDWVNDKYLNRVQELLDDLSQGRPLLVSLVDW